MEENQFCFAIIAKDTKINHYMQVCPHIIYQQLESFDLKPFNSLNCRYYPSDSFELGIPYVFVHSKGSNMEKSIKHMS